MVINFKNVSSTEAKKLIEKNMQNENFKIIDFRTIPEFSESHIDNALNIDIYSSNLIPQLNQLNKEKEYLIYCRSGSRTRYAMQVMMKLNFKNVYNLEYGLIDF